MTNDYRIEPAGTVFRVRDPWGEYLVDLFPTREAAQQDIDRCKREDEMYETAQQLVNIAIEAHMQKFGVDRETAEYGFTARWAVRRGRNRFGSRWP